MSTALWGATCFIAAIGVGHIATKFLIAAALAVALKFTLGFLGIVWVFSLTVYNKLSDLPDLSGIDYRQHRNIEIEIRARINWFWLRAIFLGGLALLIYLPTIFCEADQAIPDWTIKIAFGALALAFFSLRKVWSELEEIRELKSYVKEIERREKERVDQLKNLKEGYKDTWEPDDKLNGFREPPLRENSKDE